MDKSGIEYIVGTNDNWEPTGRKRSSFKEPTRSESVAALLNQRNLYLESIVCRYIEFQ